MPVVFYILGLIASVGSIFCLTTASRATTTVFNQVDVFNFGLAHDSWLAIAVVLGIFGAVFIATGAITQAMLSNRDPE